MTLVQQFNISHLAALSGSDVHLLTETERVSNTTSVEAGQCHHIITILGAGRPRRLCMNRYELL